MLPGPSGPRRFCTLKLGVHEFRGYPSTMPKIHPSARPAPRVNSFKIRVGRWLEAEGSGWGVVSATVLSLAALGILALLAGVTLS